MKETEIKKTVRERYGAIAKKSGNSCGCTPASASSCCGSTTGVSNIISKSIGYSDKDLNSVPEGANLGLGCGNPVALASLKDGETVLDLGSGAGFDCFLASEKVGATGKVIGVDMTPDMLDKARENCKKGGYNNVEFRLGEIENLPVADNSIDIIISNCVINLCSDKDAVYKEAFRILRAGGRLAISDIILTEEFNSELRERFQSTWAGCLGGAIAQESYWQIVRKAGFAEIQIVAHRTLTPEELEVMVRCPGEEFTPTPAKEDLALMQGKVTSIKFTAVKPSLN